MTVPFPFQAVLLDVDGTLIDSNGAHAEAWTLSLREHGVAAEVERIRPLIGMGGDKLLPAAAQVSEDSALGQSIARRKKHIFETLLPFISPTPGARLLLEWLGDQGVDLAIATSANDREMRPLLKRAGIDDLIRKRTSKDDAAKSKPDPDIVRAALARTRAPRELTVLIGDTPYDIEAAHRAGIGAIALRCGGHWSDIQLRGALEIFNDPAALLGRWQESRTAVMQSVCR